MTTPAQTTPSLTPPADAVRENAKRGNAPHGNPWRPSFRGVVLAAWIELLRRRPSTKGYIVYAAAVVGIIALSVVAAINAGPEKNSVAFELVLILILGAGMLIGPSLSATSINGDSSEGVLAPLQMTRLTAADLALGKLFASWIVCVAALLTTAPLLAYSFSRSGWSLGEAATALGVILFIVLALTAVGLAWSAIAARAVASVSLTHLTTGLLVLGTLLLFVFTLPLVGEDVHVTSHDRAYDQMTQAQRDDPNFDASTLPCVELDEVYTINHTDKTAWMLLLNPAIVVVESAPLVNPDTYKEDGRAAPGIFAMLHQSVSGARLGPQQPEAYNGCTGDYGDPEAYAKRQAEEAMLPANPIPGLALSAALLLGSMWLVVRRLRVPYKKLRTGTRVA